MSNPLGKIGKSLLKFFKPVRVAPPHSKPQEYVPPDLSKESKSFALLRFRKKGQGPDANTAGVERENRVPAETNLPAVDEHHQIIDTVPKQWLELVVSLLSVCRRASGAMRRKVGLDTYRRMLANKGHNKIQTVGSIVDTTPMVRDTSDDEKKEDDAA